MLCPRWPWPPIRPLTRSSRFRPIHTRTTHIAALHLDEERPVRRYLVRLFHRNVVKCAQPSESPAVCCHLSRLKTTSKGSWTSSRSSESAVITAPHRSLWLAGAQPALKAAACQAATWPPSAAQPPPAHVSSTCCTPAPLTSRRTRSVARRVAAQHAARALCRCADRLERRISLCPVVMRGSGTISRLMRACSVVFVKHKRPRQRSVRAL